jgi:transposase InsO family protein
LSADLKSKLKNQQGQKPALTAWAVSNSSQKNKDKDTDKQTRYNVRQRAVTPRVRAASRGIKPKHTQPGNPQKNAYIER